MCGACAGTGVATQIGHQLLSRGVADKQLAWLVNATCVAAMSAVGLREQWFLNLDDPQVRIWTDMMFMIAPCILLIIGFAGCMDDTKPDGESGATREAKGAMLALQACWCQA